jgi:photosystem II stability/assembly factor-like uncharacterized protein
MPVNPATVTRLYIATGSEGKVATSTDGINWNTYQLEDPASGINFNAVAFGGGRALVVGTLGTVYTTVNGVDWTKVVFFDGVKIKNKNLTAVTYTLDSQGVGRFVIVSNEGFYAYSTNGFTFYNPEFRPVGALDTDPPIIYNVWGSDATGAPCNSLLAVSGDLYAYGDNGLAFKCGDLLTGVWSNADVTIPPALDGVDLKCSCYGGFGSLVCMLVAGTNGKLFRSTDGLHYDLNTNLTITGTIKALIYVPESQFFMLGTDNGLVFRSIDGVNWSDAGDSLFAGSSINTLFAGSDKYIAAGSGGRMSYLLFD